MTWPFLIINNFFSRCRTHLFLSLHAVFLLKQLWGKMVKHQIATVHATQQVVARLPKNEWVCSCHQPCLAGLREVEMLKPFLCLHPPECLAVLDQGFLPVFFFFLTKFSEIIDHIFYWYLSRVSIAIDIVIILSPSPTDINQKQLTLLIKAKEQRKKTFNLDEIADEGQWQ